MQYRIHREGDAQNTPSSASTPVDNWERNTLREVLLAAYQEQRRARIWRNIWRGVAVLIFLSLIFRPCGRRRKNHEHPSPQRTHRRYRPDR